MDQQHENWHIHRISLWLSAYPHDQAAIISGNDPCHKKLYGYHFDRNPTKAKIISKWNVFFENFIWLWWLTAESTSSRCPSTPPNMAIHTSVLIFHSLSVWSLEMDSNKLLSLGWNFNSLTAWPWPENLSVLHIRVQNSWVKQYSWFEQDLTHKKIQFFYTKKKKKVEKTILYYSIKEINWLEVIFLSHRLKW